MNDEPKVGDNLSQDQACSGADGRGRLTGSDAQSGIVVVDGGPKGGLPS